SRSDRVGKSRLEEQYEDMLRGHKEKTEYTTTEKGDVLGTDVVVVGERGKDLMITIDMEFQEKVDEIVLKELKSARANGGNPYLEDALAVAMDPQTGEVLALSGFHYDKESNEYHNSPHKTLYDSN